MTQQFKPDGYASRQRRASENQHADGDGFTPDHYQTHQRHAGDAHRLYTGLSPAAFDFWAPTFTADGSDPSYPAGTLFSPGFVGNTIATSIWDKVFISGAPTPGLADVTVRRERAVDVKKPSGTDGATTTIHGIEPARIEIKLTIWTPEQLKALKELWPILLTPPYKTATKKNTVTVFVATFGPGSADTTTASVSAGNVSTTTIPQATTETKVVSTTKVTTAVTFDVSHPKFAMHRVKSIQILGGEGPNIDSARRGVFTIHAIEYLKPKGTVTNTPVQSKGSILDAPSSNTPGTNPANSQVTG